MVLRLYNGLTRRKEDFAPIDADDVRLYVCGPTVYDRAHIGNARPLIVFDVVYRLLRHLYGVDHVRYVRNITDVDDKINARAAERGITIGELTETTARGFQEDAASIGCLVPTVEPRATQHIAEMLAIIERLIASGHAYAADGHVLFDTPSMPDYGQLSRRPLDELIAGARVEVAPYKRNDGDFVLWKPAAPAAPGWDSPWGRGRPGWHIECSAMSWKHLGEVFDIHGGGIDLIFPHHENEVAQTRCAFGHATMANFWMHNGFLQVEGEKMSKSLGNFITIHDLLTTKTFGGRSWPGEVLRLAMLRTHYQKPIDWTVQALEEAEKTLDRWYAIAADQPIRDESVGRSLDGALAPLLDDVNTPAMLGDLHRLFGDDPMTGIGVARVLGLLQDTPAAWAARRRDGLSVDAAEVQTLIEQRLAARAARDWAESDRLRDVLLALGVALKDNKDGTTTWDAATRSSV
ncbi:cysteine--tRNA ligase [Lichenihabitans psoromatis]|uniref:cysteine--tRNA ligase n=1 Tax=Lichenihabitans psoromatis TaxID=2528642 RepID=UPI00103550F6|nr:cysteine--tRNA ligase [Lichenihabitans psoromatis]